MVGSTVKDFAKMLSLVLSCDLVRGSRSCEYQQDCCPICI